MHDIKKVVAEPARFKELLASGEDETTVDEIIRLERERRALVLKTDELRAERNAIARAVGLEKRPPTPDERRKSEDLARSLGEVETDLRQINADLRARMLIIPNLPLDDVPPGADERDNAIEKTVGEAAPAPHGKAHWDIAAELGLFDLEAAVNSSGARFYFLTGAGATLHRALVNWMLDVNTTQFGYAEAESPVLVKQATMVASGNLPKFKENLYYDGETDLWLIPTAEVSLNGYYQGAILTDKQLPIKLVAATNCFRKERAGAGRDVRGVKRVHQFQKVEAYRIETPENALAAQDEMVAQISDMCARLGFAHRIVKLCRGELGFQSARTYDIEIWASGSREWLEVSSISTCGDFQARRSNLRYKVGGGKTRLPHTLNGSALALPRVWAALLENNYQDGRVAIPAVLQPYTRFAHIGAPH